MRLKLIACKALFREISLVAAHEKNFIDATFIRQGFHETPELLRKTLQAEIDKIDADDDVYSYKSPYEARDFDAILLGYGLCSNGIVGLSSKRFKLVVPKAHDCITLFLGSKEKYKEYFDKYGGTYWYNASWIENGSTPSEETEKLRMEKYTELYGEENAKFLVTQEMMQNYERCAYVRWSELPFPKYEEYTKKAAEYFGWSCDIVDGSSSLLRDFLGGKWDGRFLTAEPGERIAPDYKGGDVIITEKQ